MKPGIYADISNEDYHAGEGISKSGLDLIHRSPAHYMAAKLAPREETPALVLGTAVHAAVLEPDRFLAEYVATPAFDRRTKAGREVFAEFQVENAGKTLIAQEQYETALAIRDAVYAHPVAKRLLVGGRAEQSAYWEQEIAYSNPMLCKCRPDYLRPDGLIVDLKTTEDARADHFLRSVVNYRYYVQQAWYQRGLSLACRGASTEDGVMPTEALYLSEEGENAFIFLAVEKQPPYGIGVYLLPPELAEQGRIEMEQDLALYASCMRSGTWPGYAESVQVLDMPKWLKG